MATTHRISAQAWFSLLSLVLVIWLIVNHTALLFKLGWIVLGAFLLSLAIRPIADWLAQWRLPRGATTLMFFILQEVQRSLLGERTVQHSEEHESQRV